MNSFIQRHLRQGTGHLLQIILKLDLAGKTALWGALKKN